MKRNRVLLSLVVAAALQSGVVFASPYPSDGEAPNTLPPLDTYADQQMRMGEAPEVWGVSRRAAEDPFPSGGGYIDD